MVKAAADTIKQKISEPRRQAEVAQDAALEEQSEQ